MEKITVVFILSFLSFMARQEIIKKYNIVIPENIMLCMEWVSLGLLIILVIIFYNADQVFRSQILAQILNVFLMFLTVYFCGSLHILFKDMFVFNTTAYEFFGIKLSKYFWTDNQMHTAAIQYIKENCDTNIAKLLEINTIIIQSNNNVETLYANLDKAIVAKKALVGSWSYTIWNLFGLAEFSYSKTSGIILIAIVGFVLKLGVSILSDYFYKKGVNSMWLFVKNDHETLEILKDKLETQHEVVSTIQNQQNAVVRISTLENERVTNLEQISTLANEKIMKLEQHVDLLTTEVHYRNGVIESILKTFGRDIHVSYLILYKATNLLGLLGHYEESLSSEVREEIKKSFLKMLFSIEAIKPQLKLDCDNTENLINNNPFPGEGHRLGRTLFKED